MNAECAALTTSLQFPVLPFIRLSFARRFGNTMKMDAPIYAAKERAMESVIRAREQEIMRSGTQQQREALKAAKKGGG